MTVLDILLHALGELLFPADAEDRRVACMTHDELHTLVRPRRVGNTIVLLPYVHADIRALIRRGKYHRNTRAWKLLGFALAAYLHSTDTRRAVLVPIPLSATRFRERGHNQVTSILHYTHHLLPTVTLDTRLLIRTRHTQKQTELSRTQRLRNMDAAFTATPAATQYATVNTKLPIVLVDDVTTTGATLRAAHAALCDAGLTNVSCIALAH